MRIAICERSTADRQLLIRLLEEAFSAHSVRVVFEQYDDAQALLLDLQNGETADAAFLDLSDTPEDTLATASRLRALPFYGALIFTASLAEFAVDGYDLDVDGYLLKPYRPERLLRLVARLARTARPQCLTVCHYRTLVRLPYHEIAFAESQNTKCVIHLRNGEEYRVYRQLDELERELNDPRFLRCHQSFLVNMDTVVRADTQFELENGATVAIRQRELRRIRAEYLAYLHRSDPPLCK